MNQNQPPQDQPEQSGAQPSDAGADQTPPLAAESTPQSPGPAQPPGQYGGSAQPAPGYGAPSQAGDPQAGGHTGPPPAGPGGVPGGAPGHGGYGGPPPGYGGPQAGPAYPPQGPGAPGRAGPGLFDLTFRTPLAPRIAKLTMIALWVLGGLIAVAGLVGFITVAINSGPYGYGGSMVFAAVVDMFVAFATALVLVLLGRIGIELALAVIAGRQAKDDAVQ